MNRVVMALAALLAASASYAREHSHEQPGCAAEAAPAEDSACTRGAPTESERRHVPPPPPEHVMGDMSNERMIELMGMDDDAPHSMLLLDRLEWSEAHGEDALGWEAQGWFGGDYTKAWFKTEGEVVDGRDDSRNELLWDRIVGRWWSLQAGVRHDLGAGPSRTWAAVGVQGLAPYWIEMEATAYLGEGGRTAARLSAETDVLFTQRLILQPGIELNAYGDEDRSNGLGSGLADTEVALRLRYEIRREFAPYVGVVWTRLYGETADFARASGRDPDDLQFVAGLRVWF